MNAILIVDDEPDIVTLLSDTLADEGYHVLEANHRNQVTQYLDQRCNIDCVLLDVWLHGRSEEGLALLEIFLAYDPAIPIIMMSGHSTVTTAVNALQKGAYDFLEKPFTASRLLTTVTRAFEKRHLQQKTYSFHEPQGLWVGVSPVTRAVTSTIEKVAPSPARVFIHGPAGSGKTHLAFDIHKKSAHAKGPFILLKGSSLLTEDAKTHLWGYEHAGRVYKGIWEEAQNGTLVIDEVTDIPLEVQMSLLAALQGSPVYRVGGNTPLSLSVRLITTSRLKGEEAVQQGLLREDLFYRLNVVPVSLSPLFLRPEDIEPLAHEGLRRAHLHLGIPAIEWSIDPAALAVLQAYRWPGNVRELLNMMERILITWPQEVPMGHLTSTYLPEELKNTFATLTGGSSFETLLQAPLRQAREAFEKDYLRAQLARFHGHVAKTSEFIGLERTALHRKLKSLGISSEPNTNS